MLTDWLLVRRAAQELERELRGARALGAGRLEDGRIAIELWTRVRTHLLCIDPFGTPPLVTLETGELPIAAEPGFVRALGTAVRGSLLSSVQSRKNDRLMRIDFTTRSKFGVVADCALVIELVPKFGNIVLTKNDVIVAALREFSLSENATRAIESGHRYQPPPLRADAAIPRSIAENYGPAEAAAIVEAFGSETPAAIEGLFVYRRNGELEQAHLVPLPQQLRNAACTREPALLDLFREMRGRAHRREVEIGSQHRRAALAKRLLGAEGRARKELTALDARRARSERREELRQEGDAIFATLHDVLDDQAKVDAKDRAAKLFAQYKKLGAAFPHIAEREKKMRAALEAITELRWELERAADADLNDVEDAVALIDRRPSGTPTARRAPVRRKRKPLEMRTQSGSRILIGRNPAENADLTFRVAQPNDLWFHVQGQPGAHVILRRDDRTAPPDDDIRAAAAYAAFNSKAKSSAKVAVDYTQRKHVRKQPNAPPGLVFYTHASTLTIAPEAPNP